MLCRHHHRELHKGVFLIKAEQSKFVFTTANGKSMVQSLYPQFANSTATEPSSKEFFDHQWPLIDSKTAVTKWAGEVMDYGMAVDGLIADARSGYITTLE